jgi:hypothetical protein
VARLLIRVLSMTTSPHDIFTRLPQRRASCISLPPLFFVNGASVPFVNGASVPFDVANHFFQLLPK